MTSQPAARKDRWDDGTLKSTHGFPGGDAVPPGWKPRLYVSQDGRRYRFQTGSQGRYQAKLSP
jgi:hypothetical protein